MHIASDHTNRTKFFNRTEPSRLSISVSLFIYPRVSKIIIIAFCFVVFFEVILKHFRFFSPRLAAVRLRLLLDAFVHLFFFPLFYVPYQ